MRWSASLLVPLMLLSGCSFGIEVGYSAPETDPPAQSGNRLPGPWQESDCIAPFGGGWVKVACTDPDAQASVTKVSHAEGNQRFTLKPDCPPGTDQAVSLPGPSSQTYVCARNLNPPHPGDPGMGGGILEVGDCLHGDGKNVGEVPCDGSGDTPNYKIFQISGTGCPVARTDEAFNLGSTVLGVPEGGYACAEKL
ncbi:hypothetical protein Q0Z83_008030 [Actinoplanes sichuanensis]|uniref:Lipoprotein n=1 Tax=Actinoplanes sichuanensis TaxID=512349 RepID=A0ABW4AF52_9ACTN|nr:hypothetical protein [Actinoplanes sichuanensis]BEL02612.1 hypothetical protein Q0Z83_008030 [Actinoplanes sichuanensis]